MKTVKDIMSSSVAKVSEDNTVQHAARLMCKKNIGSVVVVKGGKLTGIFTERDISKKIVAENIDPSKTLIKDVMHRSIVTANPSVTIFEASTIMEKGHFRRLPVIKDKKIIGIVTQTDIELALREEAIEELKTKIHELELFNKMAIGRELKMAELKKRIKELEGKR